MAFRFKSFEGMQERAVTESERQGIPDLDRRKANGCFLWKVGMRNVLSSEEERRDQEGT